ncbi:hypothetical protein GJ700_28750 [Duganella sp. FT92W]|uniref:HTH domain-containing protein n=1 Tax=Pseudoduganella rivuli TaxID=2666085 RepID=A0A7X2ITY6_9BURK|nr:hypothetical protein [Pseudoduganella rivuli]MRV75712.1 hypothetical protein [Pseudoduganella rivuli]
MALPDRALNILELILAHSELKGPEVALVGHSTGGLLIKQMMRTISSLASSRVDAAEFQTQVRRVALIATPNSGTDQASLKDRFRIFTRPSAAAVELVRNNPGLRDLNHWYREWAITKGIRHLILTETKPTSWFWGLISKPDSSDPGLSSRPIPIDADHFSICKPHSRASEVYVHLRKFLAESFNAIHPDQIVKNILDQNSRTITSIEEGQSEILQITNLNHDLLIQISEKTEGPPNPKVVPLVDAEIESRLNRLRKCRFFHEFDRVAEAKKLYSAVLTGGLVYGSTTLRARALAWCARVLADPEHRCEARTLLRSASELADCKETQVAESILLRLEGQYSQAQIALSRSEDPLSRSARFIIAQQELGSSSALEWAAKSELDFGSLDGDGKFFWVTSLIASEKWEDALNLAATIHEADFEQSPVLLFTAALSNLFLAVPAELRKGLESHIPFELDTFPLNDDEHEILLRRKARDLFLRASIAAKDLFCRELEHTASDYHLWLMLRDPESKDEGLNLLKRSLDHSEYPLRRVNFAFRFGLKLDFDSVEREIDKQDAINGGASLDAAFARLVLTLNQGTPLAVLKYLSQHRPQLQGHLIPDLLDSIEIQALTSSGQLELAEEKIVKLKESGVPESTLEKLRRFIAGAAGSDASVTARIIQYKESKKISDLSSLVDALLQNKDWDQLVQYSGELYTQTKSIGDAETLVIALENSGMCDKLEQFLSAHTAIIEQSEILMTSWSWVLFRAGRLYEASNVLQHLLSQRDDRRDRLLEVNIAIASGAWESLAEFAEKQWKNREKRSAEELMHSARIGLHISAPRAKDLMLAAIEISPTSPQILLDGYMLATEADWDLGEISSSWLNRAAEYSGDDGPVRKLSLKEVVDSQPDWNRRATETIKNTISGEMPTFLAAKMLNRTLVDLVLANGILNINQADTRRRAIISAFSGARVPVAISNGHLALDATAILTLGRLGLLDKLKSTFKTISIPHSTLPLFFKERKKVKFHQPSQIKRSIFTLQLISLGEIFISSEKAPINSDLAFEIGNELSALISEVSMKRNDGYTNHFVATSFPVHRVGSLREEEVDLSAYSDILCHAGSVLNKLITMGHITIREQQLATDYLKMQGQLTCCNIELPDGATVYFDDLTFIHLYHAGILNHLHKSGLKVYLSPASVAHAKSLIDFEHLAPEQLTVIDDIKSYLETGIAEGDIVLSPAPKDSDISDYELIAHPSLSVFQNIENIDILMVDDRYLNHHTLLSDNTTKKETPIITSIDLLSSWNYSGVLRKEQFYGAMTTLRRACYVFVPIDLLELQYYFELSTVRDGVIIENAELRAVREYLLKIRMSDALRIPKEGPWLESIMRVFTTSLKNQWLSGVSEDIAAARSNWLWKQIDALEWASILPEDTSFENAIHQYKMQNMLLILNLTNVDSLELRNRYWRWLERDVIFNLKSNHPDVYGDILTWCGNTIAEIASKDYTLEDNDELR